MLHKACYALALVAAAVGHRAQAEGGADSATDVDRTELLNRNELTEEEIASALDNIEFVKLDGERVQNLVLKYSRSRVRPGVKQAPFVAMMEIGYPLATSRQYGYKYLAPALDSLSQEQRDWLKHAYPNPREATDHLMHAEDYADDHDAHSDQQLRILLFGPDESFVRSMTKKILRIQSEDAIELLGRWTKRYDKKRALAEESKALDKAYPGILKKLGEAKPGENAAEYYSELYVRMTARRQELAAEYIGVDARREAVAKELAQFEGRAMKPTEANRFDELDRMQVRLQVEQVGVQVELNELDARIELVGACRRRLSLRKRSDSGEFDARSLGNLRGRINQAVADLREPVVGGKVLVGRRVEE